MVFLPECKCDLYTMEIWISVEVYSTRQNIWPGFTIKKTSFFSVLGFFWSFLFCYDSMNNFQVLGAASVGIGEIIQSFSTGLCPLFTF